MKLQPQIEQSPEDIRCLYAMVRGWRTTILLNQPKTLAPPQILSQNVIPITKTVVSSPIRVYIHIVLTFEILTLNLDRIVNRTTSQTTEN